MQIKINKIFPEAIIPIYATPGSACFDLHSLTEAVIRPGEAAILRTGLRFEIPEGWKMLVFSRSGHGFKYDVSLSNSVGVIDSDYVGEVLVKLRNDSEETFDVRVADRVAQAEVVPAWQHSFEVVDAIKETERGIRGFGSTGK